MDVRDWFDALSADKVERMKGEPETQVMDCKRVGDEKDMKPNLATVIAGFGNSAGGVCLWGVDARKNAEGIDCISDFPGCDTPVRLASRLDELTPHAVSPGVQGVQHRPLIRADGRGYVATFVPASDGGPHMARFGEDRYYQRIGQSFMRMEPFQIADMFGRRARPVLEVTPVRDGSNPYEIRLRITNVGRGAAQAPFVQLSADPPFSRNGFGVDGNRGEHLPFKHAELDGRWLHAADADVVIHPTMSLLVGGVWLGLDPTVRGTRPLPGMCTIRYKVGALGIAPAEGVLELPMR